MKKSLILTLSLLVSTTAFAEDEAPERIHEIPACQVIAQQCESAGFKPGAHKKTGMGLWVDCIRAKAQGKEVAGVTASPDDAKNCLQASKSVRKDKREERKAKKANG